MISATSSRTQRRGRSAENMVAYQPGKAANIAAPATISHTSLPSQNGPIELIASRRSASVRPTSPCSIPTPKSKPSSTKNPVQSSVTSVNQTSAKSIAGSRVSRSATGDRRSPVSRASVSAGPSRAARA